jgi:hypothetical protein
LVGVQLAFGPQEGEELASWDVVHQEIKVSRVLGEALEANLNM